MQSTLRFSKLILTVLLATFVLFGAIAPASAHDKVIIDDYKIVVGWVNEPVIVGERNALLFIVTKNDVPVEDLEATLDIEVSFAGRTFLGDLKPSATAGEYTTELFPTAKGQYEVRISGVLEDTEIDVTASPEEVLSARILQFPESVSEAREIEQQLADMQAQLDRAQMFGNIGTATGILGLLAGIVGLVMGRRKSPEAETE